MARGGVPGPIQAHGCIGYLHSCHCEGGVSRKESAAVRRAELSFANQNVV